MSDSLRPHGLYSPWNFLGQNPGVGSLSLLPTMQETWVQSLGQEDLLEKGMETHSSILAWRIPWTEEADRLQSVGLQRVGYSWACTLSSFTFIKRLFSSSLLSATRVVSSAYLRLLIFLPAILIPACVSSSSAFLLMYSAYKLNMLNITYKLNKLNIQPWHTPFSIWNQSVVPCPVLTVDSQPAYRLA